MPRVPTIKDVVAGASVNIILKADQPTGRTVSGIIADVLTRGNHPRGIKVRLTDGRVGRVQSMANGAPAPVEARHVSTTSATRSAAELPSQQVCLDAYITQAKPRLHGRGGGSKAVPAVGQQDNFQNEIPEMVTSCPVCGEFDGDEAAVAHHVATHFID
jgi:uncharacterized repeat protein (TIGR03833 family)